jgi:hypothetical protein
MSTAERTTMDTDVVRLHLAAGAPLPQGVRLSARVQRALTVARIVGAPLLPAVDAAAAAEEDAQRAVRAISVATSQSRTVAAGLVLSPVLLVPLVARLAGASALDFYTSAAGRSVLTIGAVLLGAGALVARLLVRRTMRPARDGALEEAVELVATAVSAGTGTAASLRAVAAVLPAQAAALRQLALDLDLGHVRDAVGPRGAGAHGVRRLQLVITGAAELGAPVVPTLRRLASDLRADELARVMAAAERLPAQLTFPTTLLILPATVLLVAAPLVEAGLRGVLT